MIKHQILSILFLSIIFISNSNAACLERIQTNKDTLIQNHKDSSVEYIGTGLLMPMIYFAYAPAGIVVSGGLASKYISYRVAKSGFNNLEAMIKEAYAYKENSQKPGKYLKRSFRRINRRLNKKIKMNDLVDSIIYANETNRLCETESIRDYAIKYVLDLED